MVITLQLPGCSDTTSSSYSTIEKSALRYLARGLGQCLFLGIVMSTAVEWEHIQGIAYLPILPSAALFSFESRRARITWYKEGVQGALGKLGTLTR